MPLLSVIVPVYNEAKTIRQILEKINSVNIDKEIIVIDNASVDETRRILRDIKYNNLKVIHHTTNRGKGAAFLTGLINASGDFVIIQDGDLEYDPVDYIKLMEAIKYNHADIILGARFYKGYHGLFLHRLGNKVLTGILNFLFNSRINDYATCYKLSRKTTFDNLDLRATGFDIDVEIVCSALKKKMRLYEVPIKYIPRNYESGKKIRWHDGIIALLAIIRHRFG